MRSLRYMFSGHPHTLEDCLHLARRRPPDKVTLELTVREFMSELEVVQRFVGIYQWQFKDYHVRCSEIYGCVSLLVKKQKQQSCLAAVNADLQRRLEEIEQRGIEVSGADQRFEDPEHLCARI